jgi:uncharacterized membrane protein SirB2
MNYLALKHIHVSLVVLSVSFFVIRYYWRFRATARLQERWIKITPHVLDTVLLASAIALMVSSEQYPIQQAWLSAKIIALIGYIIFASFALKRAKTPNSAHLYFLAALSCIGFMVWLARTKLLFPDVS